MKENSIVRSNDFGLRFKGCQTVEEIDFILSCMSGNQLWKQHIPEGTFVLFDLDNYCTNQGINIKEGYFKVIDLLEEISSDRYKCTYATSLTQVWHTRLIYGYKVEENTYSIWIQWNEEVRKKVSGNQIPGTFLVVDKRMGALSNKKKYLMYELLQRNLYQDSFYITLEEIYRECVISETEYREFKDFQKRVLKPTLEEIKSVLGIEIRCKKKFNKVIFTVIAKPKLKKELVKIDKEELIRLRKENYQLSHYKEILDNE